MSVTTPSPQSTRPRKGTVNWYPLWAPRFWHGMTAGDYWRLLARNRFRLHPLRVPMGVILVPVTLLNTALSWLQRGLYGRAITGTQLAEPPLFIVGHWRSGTTMMHELLVRDERFAYPTTYECMAPNHFIVTGRIIPRLIWFLLPARRPMDNMTVSFDHPQEDEFALVAMGAPSPLLRIAFPNDPPPYGEFLDMDGAGEDDLRVWRRALTRFVQALTYAKGKPLVLKSPTHTGRVGLLAEMFPGAKFVHLVRDPYSLFSSNRRLWMALDEAQAFQVPRHRQVEAYVLDTLPRMYRGFERQRKQLDPAQICDVRYEDLVRDPVGQLRAVYEQLQLGDFAAVQDKVEAYVREKKNYRPNRHELDEELKEQIRSRWADYFQQYGYS